MKQHNKSKFHPLSSSPLWQINKKWVNSDTDIFESNIPHWITSNPLFAQHIARIILMSISTIIDKNPKLANHPITIVEYGAGLGKFAFYCIKELTKQLTIFPYKNLNIKYILTDVSNSLIESWKDNTSLQPYIQKGILDYTFADINQPISTLTGYHTQKTINLHEQLFPVFYICNYIWDILPFDRFKIKDNSLYQSYVKHNVNTQRLTYKNIPCTSHPYSDQHLNTYIQQFKKNYKEITLTVPNRAINFLNTLKKTNAIILCSDKGYCYKQQLRAAGKKQLLTNHGHFFSSSVNIHCIDYWTQKNYGQTLLPKYPNSIFDTYLFAFNSTPLVNVAAYIKTHNQQQTTATMIAQTRTTLQKDLTLTTKSTIKLLYESQYDPETFVTLPEHCATIFTELAQNKPHLLKQILSKIEKNIFVMPTQLTHHIYCNLAFCYSLLGLNKKSLDCLTKAITFYPPSPLILDHIKQLQQKM